LIPDFLRFGLYGIPFIARGFSSSGEYSSQHQYSLSSSPLKTRIFVITVFLRAIFVPLLCKRVFYFTRGMSKKKKSSQQCNSAVRVVQQNPSTPPCAVVPPLHFHCLANTLRRFTVSFTAIRVGTHNCRHRRAPSSAGDSFFERYKKLPPIQVHRQLQEIYGKDCISVQHVRK